MRIRVLGEHPQREGADMRPQVLGKRGDVRRAVAPDDLQTGLPKGVATCGYSAAKLESEPQRLGHNAIRRAMMGTYFSRRSDRLTTIPR